MHMSELSTIFKPQEIEDALEEARKLNKKKEQEEVYQPKDKVRIKGEFSNQILYVARGLLVEKHGDYMDNMVGNLRIGRGRIACLQNLTSEMDNRQISDVYCHHSSMVSVVPLDLRYLKEILEDSEEKMLKYWQIIAHRLIVLNPDHLKVFLPLTNEKIKLLVKICQISIYKPYQEVDMKSGGILFRGALDYEHEDTKLGLTKQQNSKHFLTGSYRDTQSPQRSAQKQKETDPKRQLTPKRNLSASFQAS